MPDSPGDADHRPPPTDHSVTLAMPGLPPYPYVVPVAWGFPVGDPTEAKEVRENPRGEYVASFYSGEPHAIPPLPDPLTYRLGPQIYEDMGRTDGVIASSTRTVRSAAVGTKGPSLSARYPDKQGRAIDWRDPPEDTEEDVLKSAKYLEFCQWIGARMQTTLPELAWALSACFYLKNALAEKVYDYSTDFDGSARIVPADCRPKDWRTWSFVVDPYNRITAVLCLGDPAKNEYLLVPPDKFVIAAFARDTDSPVGTSAGEPLHPWWRLKVSLPKLAYNFSCLYAGLIPWIELPPGAKEEVPTDENGVPIPGARPVPAEKRAAALLKHVKSGTGIVVPNGGSLNKLESNQNATPFTQLAALCDQQNVHTLLGTYRATLPSERNSQADANASENVADFIRDLLALSVSAAFYRGLYHDAIARNWGKDEADNYCPVVSFSITGIRNFGTAAAGVAALVSAGVIKPSQYQAALQIILGILLPEPAAEDMIETAPGEVPPGQAGQEKKPIGGPGPAPNP